MASSSSEPRLLKQHWLSHEAVRIFSETSVVASERALMTLMRSSSFSWLRSQSSREHGEDGVEPPLSSVLALTPRWDGLARKERSPSTKHSDNPTRSVSFNDVGAMAFLDFNWPFPYLLPRFRRSMAVPVSRPRLPPADDVLAWWLNVRRRMRTSS